MDDLKRLELLNSELELENEVLKEKLKGYKENTKEMINDIEKKHKEEITNIILQKNEIQAELDSILYSRSYRIIQKIKKIVKGDKS